LKPRESPLERKSFQRAFCNPEPFFPANPSLPYNTPSAGVFREEIPVKALEHLVIIHRNFIFFKAWFA
jgi:hypothetical protein